MTEVWFYHLERTGLDQALPELLEKTMARGWKAVVRTPSQDRLEHLDGWLWSYRDDSFLPHGLVDEPQAERQPVLLTTAMENPNQAQALFVIDGAELGPLQGYERCLVLFDGRDDQAVAKARGQWSAARSSGEACAYWRQSGRGWEKQA
ncbi:MAG: DNA polymerase III subunit chi [Phenylobacterium sp.]